MQERRKEFGLRRAEQPRAAEQAPEAGGFKKYEAIYRKWGERDSQMKELFELYDSIVTAEAGGFNVHADIDKKAQVEKDIAERYEVLNGRG